MRLTFLEFIQKRKEILENKKRIAEAFQEKNIDKVIELIESILKKHINGIVPLIGFVDTVIDGKNCTSKQYLVFDKKDYAKTALVQFNWLNSENSVDVYSIDFFKDLDVYWSGKGKADLSIYTLGTSIVKLLPIVWTVCSTRNYKLTADEAKKIASKLHKDAKESKFYVGGLEYTLFEGLVDSIIHDAFTIESKKEASLQDEYNTILEEIASAENTDTINIDVETGKNVIIEDPQDIKNKEKESEKEYKDPEQVFKEMSKYISLIIKGLQPSLILCGAPGVGKTYRVKKQLKENNYKEEQNLCTIKGKCTARKLYLSLYDFKEHGDIVLIDDADSLVGPKADENCINILKAALDSSSDREGRLVTYGVAGKILDDEGNEVPKRFYYKGGTIVITNYRAGALDTALRGRSFIQDIDFKTSDVLAIVKKLLPDIEPDLFSMKTKLKAYKYLLELNEKGSDMELSLRTFVLCSKIFEACDNDTSFTDDDAKSMIEEQMKLQYARAGANSKY